MTRLLGSLLVLLALTTACNSAPPADGLRDSFAEQLSANKFISDFQRSGDNIGEKVEITGADSNLPIELTSNGLGQECWAFWDAGAKRWGWE